MHIAHVCFFIVKPLPESLDCASCLHFSTGLYSIRRNMEDQTSHYHCVVVVLHLLSSCIHMPVSGEDKPFIFLRFVTSTLGCFGVPRVVMLTMNL